MPPVRGSARRLIRAATAGTVGATSAGAGLDNVKNKYGPAIDRCRSAGRHGVFTGALAALSAGTGTASSRRCGRRGDCEADAQRHGEQPDASDISAAGELIAISSLLSPNVLARCRVIRTAQPCVPAMQRL